MESLNIKNNCIEFLKIHDDAGMKKGTNLSCGYDVKCLVNTYIAPHNRVLLNTGIRLKENISDVQSGIDTVLKMKPKHFDYIDGNKDNLGFIAQEIQKIIPQAVGVVNEDTGYLGLQTDFLVPYLTKAIQEQQTIIEDLKSRIETLEG